MYSAWFIRTLEYFIMHHDLLRDARFWSFLLLIDQDLAKIARERDVSCNGRLHSAHYLRNPRGGPEIFPRSVVTG